MDSPGRLGFTTPATRAEDARLFAQANNEDNLHPPPSPARPHPDPRLQGLIQMVTGQQYTIHIQPTLAEFAGPAGSIVFAAGQDGFIHILYIPPVQGEPQLELYAGCIIVQEQHRLARAVAMGASTPFVHQHMTTEEQ